VGSPIPLHSLSSFLRVFGANWQLHVTYCYNGGWSLERSLPLGRVMLPNDFSVLEVHSLVPEVHLRQPPKGAIRMLPLSAKEQMWIPG